MAQLPLQKTDNLPLSLIQTSWKALLDPVLANPVMRGQQISTSLINGVTVINHKLGRQMQGWFITDINAAATVYRSQPFNDLTLTLTSNAACAVNLWVF